jgi:hypothetical protein
MAAALVLAHDSWGESPVREGAVEALRMIVDFAGLDLKLIEQRRDSDEP